MATPEFNDSSAAPNVVSAEAAARIMAAVFDARGEAAIAPVDVAAALVQEGYGAEFEPEVRAARVLTWTKQVFRRLRKYGWLASRTEAEWRPTAALSACKDRRALTRRAPGSTRTRRVPRPPRAARAPGEPARAAPPSAGPGESWPDFIDARVHSRGASFAIGDLVADMIRHGFGTGTPHERLEAARRVVEERLRALPDVPSGNGKPPDPPSPHRKPEVDTGPAAVQNRPDPTEPGPKRSSRMDAELEGVLATFHQKHAAALREAEFYARMIRELQGMFGGEPAAEESATEAPVEDRAVPVAPEPPARTPDPASPRRRPAKGGMTITEAIQQVIEDAGQPLTPAEIVPEAARLAGAKEISVRTQITPLAQAGMLAKVEHDGRGFRYGLPPEGSARTA